MRSFRLLVTMIMVGILLFSSAAADSEGAKEATDNTGYTSEQLAAIKASESCAEKYGDCWPIEEIYRIDVLFYEVGLAAFITSGIPNENELSSEDALSIAYQEMASRFALSDDVSALWNKLEFYAADADREWRIYFSGFTSGELSGDELISIRLDAATGDCLGVYTNADGVG